MEAELQNYDTPNAANYQEKAKPPHLNSINSTENSQKKLEKPNKPGNPKTTRKTKITWGGKYLALLTRPSYQNFLKQSKKKKKSNLKLRTNSQKCQQQIVKKSLQSYT